MSKTIHSIIKSEYDKKQQNALDRLNMKKAEVNLTIPRLQAIDSEIQLAGVKVNKSILMGTASVNEGLKGLLDTIAELREERQRLLHVAGFPLDYLEIEHTCDKCKDTGLIELDGTHEKCACYKQKLINHLYSQSNLKLAETENFASFDETLYPDFIDHSRFGIDISPRENILGIKNRCLEFIKNFSTTEDRNLFFTGPTGVGKTFMSNCIAMALLNRGVTVLYQTAPMLFNTINEYKMKAFKEDNFQDRGYKDIFDVELLIIDDLATESASASRYAEFLNILNVRQVNNNSRPCKTIISTNIGVKELYEYYDERVASRIIGGFDMYRFTGKDIRSMK